MILCLRLGAGWSQDLGVLRHMLLLPRPQQPKRCVQVAPRQVLGKQAQQGQKGSRRLNVILGRQWLRTERAFQAWKAHAGNAFSLCAKSRFFAELKSEGFRVDRGWHRGRGIRRGRRVV